MDFGKGQQFIDIKGSEGNIRRVMASAVVAARQAIN